MRIVAGSAKGRRLAPPATGTRPTADRVRESLFNALATRLDLEGARVLDLYAGSGAVGLEALSRGAATAVLVEHERAALAVLRRNVATVGLPGASVVERDVTAYLRGVPDAAFDLVFADPPYALADDVVAEGLDLLRAGGWLAPGGLVVLERSARGGAGAAGDTEDWLTAEAERTYGEALLWYGRRR